LGVGSSHHYSHMLARAYISKNPYLSDEIDAAADREIF
jgi:hypothetical protein